MNPDSLNLDQLRDTVRGLPPSTLASARETALVNLQKFGLPDTRHEDWKYTDISEAIAISNRCFIAGAEAPKPKNLTGMADAITSTIDADWVVIANGRIELGAMLESKGIDIERYSESSAPRVLQHPLADFNAALLNDGLRIRIHAATEKPLGLLFVDNVASSSMATHSNIEIDVAAGCAAEIVEYHHSSGDGEHYANGVVSLQVGEMATASYLRIQDRKIGHVQTNRQIISMRKDSRLRMASYDLGGSLVRNDVDIDICEPGVDAVFSGLYLAADGQHIDNHTRVDHRVGPASSSQEYRGILSGRCRCVWNGKAIVHSGADGTAANQANHNLLLSDKAEIDAKPELEIYADDVKCSHGTTVGQLDESALFYLRSRGLDKQQARQILMHAFARDLIGRAPVVTAAEQLTRLVEARLSELMQDDSA